jgi:hypothetical protein
MIQKECSNELDNITVSYSHSTHNSYLTQTTLGDIFDRIENDKELKRTVDAIRSESDKDKRRKIKEENLPYFVLGTFTDNHRRSEKLISTEFISVDFDDLDGRSVELDEKLRADENVFSYFISPSNNRKAIYKLDKPITDRTEYSHIYSHFLNELNTKYGFEADSQTSDAARAIFLSYDPDIYVNNNSKPLCTDEVPEYETASTKINFKELGEELRYLPMAAAFLRSVKLDYYEWVQCGLALTQFGEKGRGYFYYLSTNKFYKDTSDEINRKYDNLLDSSEGKVTLATLFQIAKDHGFNYSAVKETEEIEEETIPFHIELEERFKIDDTRDPNKLLGFPLDKFKTLANNVDGLQPGFYFLGAESNVGKTALLTNLTLDALDTNPDVAVMYFSLDDSRMYTAYRFLSIQTKFHINEVKKPQVNSIQTKFHINEVKKPQVNSNSFITLQAHRQRLLDLIKNERLIVKDLAEVNHMDHLVKQIDEYPDHDNLIVMVDGLYNLEVGAGKNEGIRVQNIEKANKIKLITDKYRIPLISTGELRKKMKGESKRSKCKCYMASLSKQS